MPTNIKPPYPVAYYYYTTTIFGYTVGLVLVIGGYFIIGIGYTPGYG